MKTAQSALLVVKNGETNKWSWTLFPTLVVFINSTNVFEP